MKGGVYSKEHCPICGKIFQRLPHDLICVEHQTRPKTFFVQIYNKETHRHKEIYSDPKSRRPFRSYEEAERELTVIRKEIDDSGDFDITRYIAGKIKPLRFTNWVDEWTKKKQTEMEKGLKSPSYLKAIKVYVRKYESFFSDIDIRDIKTKTVYDFYLSLKGAPHYIKNIMDCLEKILRDALDWGDIHQLPKFPKIEVPEPSMEIIDPEKQDEIINSIPDQMERIFILFTARQMLRPCEPRALFWADLNFKRHRVLIRRHFSINMIRPATKSRNIRDLPLDMEVEQALLALPRHISSPFVFWKGRAGRPFSESWARKVWKKYAKQSGVGVGLYCGTKHSSATEATDRVGIDAVQEFLGHTSRRTTQRYIKANPERLRKVLRK